MEIALAQTALAQIALAIDIGGSKLMAGLVSSSGKVLCMEKLVWSELTPAGVIRDIKKAAHSLLDANPEYKPMIMGSTIPGLADPEKGIWVESSFSGIRNLPYASIMKEEFGLPVRNPWANDYRGRAMVLYGHTPVPDVEWVNNTMCLDTGCVFGGRLTALRYPEKEIVQVPAKRVYYTPARPLAAPRDQRQRETLRRGAP